MRNMRYEEGYRQSLISLDNFQVSPLHLNAEGRKPSPRISVGAGGGSSNHQMYFDLERRV